MSKCQKLIYSKDNRGIQTDRKRKESLRTHHFVRSLFGRFLGKESSNEGLDLPSFDLSPVNRVEEQPQLLQEVLVNLKGDLKASDSFENKHEKSIETFAQVVRKTCNDVPD